MSCASLWLRANTRSTLRPRPRRRIGRVPYLSTIPRRGPRRPAPPAAGAAHGRVPLSSDDPGGGAAAPPPPRLRTSSLRRIAQTWWPGLLRDEQAPGDVGVAPPLCDEGEHLDLPRREPRRVRARG